MTSSNTRYAQVGRMGLAIAAAAACVLAASCGGGGGSGSNNSNTPVATIAQQVATCDHGQPQSQVAVPTTGNSVPVMIDSGPCAYGVPFGSPSGTASSVYKVGAANVPYTSVTICTPGSTTACQTIDHILVDTGSSGLRLMSSVLTGAATLPAISVNNAPLIECVQFADGYSWGSIRTADVHIAGESAMSLPVQVVGDSSSYTVPSGCLGTSTTPLSPLNDVGSFGSNGVLGVGLFKQDCGPGCVGPLNAGNGFYYSCPTTSSCSGFGPAISQQVTNPVALFATDNNGVVLQFPNVPAASGALNVQGTLSFGINTQTNNQASAGTLNTYLAEPDTGPNPGDFISTLLTASGGYNVPTTAFSNSFIDSGSNAIYFPNTGTPTVIPTDATYSWFIPVVPSSSPADVITLTATQQSYTGAIGPAGFSFEIANANTVLFPSGSGNNTVFNGLGAPSGTGSGSTGGVDWGLPFFLGKTIYVGLEGDTISIAGTQQTGPFWAY